MLLRGILLLTLVSVTLAQGNSPADNDAREVAKLAAMVGKWKTSGEIFHTKFSHSGKTSSIMTCEWSPNHRFVISDQVIETPDGTKNQLGVFGYDPHAGQFYSYTFFAAGGAPFTSHPEISGNVWTYNGEFKNGDTTVRTRTRNIFISHDTMIFETQFSEDGINWVTMMKGKDVRIK